MITLKYRFATITDTDLYYKWVTDPSVRQNSFQQGEIAYNGHVKWFNMKLQSNDCYFYLFLNENNLPVGQVRIDKDDDETIISISIDENFRGRSLGVQMLTMSCEHYLQNNPNTTIVAYIKETNISSYKTFVKAGFGNAVAIQYGGNETFKLTKKST